MTSDQILGPIWSQCFSLALEGFAAGSLGISALVATSEGAVISKGRNQLYDRQASTNCVRINSLAHAELNAIATLPEAYQERRDLILYATVESCPLCMGAVVISRIRTVHIASRDGWAGCGHLLETDAFYKRKNVKIHYETGPVEKTFFLLHMLSHWRRLDHQSGVLPPFYLAIAERYPQYAPYVQALATDEAFMEQLNTKNAEAVFARIQTLECP